MPAEALGIMFDCNTYMFDKWNCNGFISSIRCKINNKSFQLSASE